MSWLIIGDVHLPFEHRDALAFVDCLQKKYKPKETIQIGDFFDLHHQSWHDKHPELPGARAEFDAAKKKAGDWGFYVDVVTEGNHCLRPERVAQKFGLLPEMVTQKNVLWDITTAFVREHWITLPDRTKVLCRHGDRGFPQFGSRARRFTHHTVTGHHHTLGGIQHYTLMDGTRRWMAATGCLIDPDSPAFSYTPHKPVLGSLAITDEGLPVYHPMKLNGRGRWTGKL